MPHWARLDGDLCTGKGSLTANIHAMLSTSNLKVVQAMNLTQRYAKETRR
jgi:hypothetical protein